MGGNMDSMFIFGQIVAVVALCCGAVLSVFATASAPSGEDRRRHPAE